jgi:hypothetical protein
LTKALDELARAGLKLRRNSIVGALNFVAMVKQYICQPRKYLELVKNACTVREISRGKTHLAREKQKFDPGFLGRVDVIDLIRDARAQAGSYPLRICLNHSR